LEVTLSPELRKARKKSSQLDLSSFFLIKKGQIKKRKMILSVQAVRNLSTWLAPNHKKNTQVSVADWVK